MTKVDVVKAVLGTIASVGVGAIVGNAVVATTPAAIGIVQKIFVGAGSVALTGWAGNVAATQVEKDIDQVVDIVQSVKDEIE